MKTFDIVIIGGGALGTFHAYHALQKGLSVALLEKDQQPQSATVRNFGQVVPSGMNAKWQKYGRRSLEIYKTIQVQTDITVRNNGTVYFASNDEEVQLIEELSTINKDNEYTSELLAADQCLSRYEGLKKDYVKGGLFFPEEVTVEPRSAIHQIRAFLIEQFHLAYFPNHLAIDAHSQNGKATIKCTNGATFEATKVIICSGSEFKFLYPEKFQASELVGVKIHMMQTGPQPSQFIKGSILTGLSIRRYESFHECPSFKTIKAKENPDSLDKQWGIHILLKQATDGSVIIGDSHHYADARNIDDLGFDVEQEINAYMLARAKEIFDLQNWNIQRYWYGVYSQCKESDIYLEDVDDHIHIVTGIGGKGMTGSAGFAEENMDRIMGSLAGLLL